MKLSMLRGMGLLKDGWDIGKDIIGWIWTPLEKYWKRKHRDLIDENARLRLENTSLKDAQLEAAPQPEHWETPLPKECEAMLGYIYEHENNRAETTKEHIFKALGHGHPKGQRLLDQLAERAPKYVQWFLMNPASGPAIYKTTKAGREYFDKHGLLENTCRSDECNAILEYIADSENRNMDSRNEPGVMSSQLGYTKTTGQFFISELSKLDYVTFRQGRDGSSVCTTTDKGREYMKKYGLKM